MPPNYKERTLRIPLHSSSARDPTPKNTPQISSPAFLLLTHKTTMNSSAENHNQKDSKLPCPSSQPHQKDSKQPCPSSQPFEQTSATGYPVIDPPSVPWSTGLCDCCQDVENCCLTCWCPCITFGRIVHIADRGSTSCGTGGALYTLMMLVTGCPCLYSCFYRTKLRGQFLLHGNKCTDCLIHCCCERCAVCQEYRELKNQGFDMEIGWNANVKRQTPGITNLPPSVTEGMSRT